MNSAYNTVGRLVVLCNNMSLFDTDFYVAIVRTNVALCFVCIYSLTEVWKNSPTNPNCYNVLTNICST